MNKKQQYIKIFAHLFLLIFIIIGFKYMLPIIFNLFMPFIIAYIIALLAEPIIKLLEKIKIKRKYSSIFIILIILSGIISIIYFVIKKIYTIIENLIKNSKDIYNTIDNFIIETNSIIETKLNINIVDTKILENIVDKFNNYITELGVKALDFISHFVTNAPMMIFVIIITIMASYFIIQDKDKYKIDLNKMPKLKLIKEQVIDTMLKYFQAQFKITFIIFIILVIGFGILGIKNFILVAFLVACIDLLPILGTGTILYPWMAISLLYGNYIQTIGLLIIYLTALISRQALQPKIIGDTMGLPGLPSLILMYLGYKIFGFTGLILSVPVGLIFLNIYKLGFFDNYKKCFKIIFEDIKKLFDFNK